MLCLVIYNQNDIDFLINKYHAVLYVITIVINTIIKITERLASEKGCWERNQYWCLHFLNSARIVKSWFYWYGVIPRIYILLLCHLWIYANNT